MVPREEPPTEDERTLRLNRRALKGAAGGGFRKVAPVRAEPPAKTSAGKGDLKWKRIENRPHVARRHPYVALNLPVSLWALSTTWAGWYWDAGLYLPSDFDSLIGYPLTLPGSATELRFHVKTAGWDYPNNLGVTTPECSVGIKLSPPGNYGPNRNPPGENTPSAGMHLWVLWYGPDAWITDPEPDETAPSLVPAFLAAGGTG